MPESVRNADPVQAWILATEEVEKQMQMKHAKSLIPPFVWRQFTLIHAPARHRLAAMAMGLAALAVPSLASASLITTVYPYSGADVNWTVPAGVTSLQVSLWGAGGGGAAFGPGSAGVYVTGSLPVTPGEALVIGVGGYGGSRANATGGFDGGGNGSSVSPVAGGGGGYSGIFLSSVSAANALVIAGGGSGGSNSASPGTPTLTAGDGTNLIGGNGAPGGGGGGGGYNGGAGGTGSTSSAGGAGSLLSNLTDSSLSAAPVGAAAVGTADPYFLSSADGAGGAAGAHGTVGEVVISYDASVPEPASLSLIGVCSFFLLCRRRRHVTV